MARARARSAAVEPKQPIVSVVGYAAAAARVARQFRDVDGADWNDVFETGIREAYRQNDLNGLTAMVHYAIGRLDGEGRFSDAVREIDHLVAIADGNVDASALLLSVRASFLVGKGQPREALESARESESWLARDASPLTRNRAGAYVASVRCRTLSPASLAEVESLLARTRAEEDGIDFLFLVSWYVPYLFALGQRNRAHAWIRGMRLQAEVSQHRWRLRDADSFALADRAVGAPGVELAGGAPRNWVARWRELVVLLRSSLLHGRWADAGTTIAELDAIRNKAHSAELDPHGAFEACLQAYSDLGTTSTEIALPDHLHLTNLPSILAGAEATALTGSQASSASWLKWLSANLPGNVETSLEWGVSRFRVEALLAVRAGDHRRARLLFERAIEWCTAEAYVLEGALCQVQLAELLAGSEICKREKLWTDLKREGWAKLRVLGIDPCPHAYAVAQSLTTNRSQLLQPRLSPRGAEVLGLLAQGFSYQEIADHLSIVRPTVQTLAHRVYEKLEVSGRARAVVVGRELGVI